MEEFLSFFVAVIVISASGVMTPGPLFASTISSGMKQKTAGLKIALGHTIVELPLVLLIGLGIISLDVFPQFRIIISIVGAASIFGFSILQIRTTLKGANSHDVKYGPYITGVLLTAFNPFFLVWWLSIGVKLISDAVYLWSIFGIFVMFALHIWMDFAWLGFVSATSSKGTKLLSGKSYKIFMIAINIILIYFGISFIVDVI